MLEMSFGSQVMIKNSKFNQKAADNKRVNILYMMKVVGEVCFVYNTVLVKKGSFTFSRLSALQT